MEQISLNPASKLNAEGQFDDIFNFFKVTELNADTPYPEVERAAQQFVDNAGPSVLKAVLDSVYQPVSDLFIFPENFEAYDRHSVIFGFQNFYRAVHNVLNGHKPLSLQSNGAKPQYILKREAFNYMGHNDLDIKPSKSSYASLFYH